MRFTRKIIKDNIEYDILKQNMPYDYDRLDEIVDLMLETVCTRRKTIRIAGTTTRRSLSRQSL